MRFTPTIAAMITRLNPVTLRKYIEDEGYGLQTDAENDREAATHRRYSRADLGRMVIITRLTDQFSFGGKCAIQMVNAGFQAIGKRLGDDASRDQAGPWLIFKSCKREGLEAPTGGWSTPRHIRGDLWIAEDIKRLTQAFEAKIQVSTVIDLSLIDQYLRAAMSRPDVVEAVREGTK